MNRSLLFTAIAIYLTGCGNIGASKRAAIEADKLFKDSVARADGDKVLGKIHFGISAPDFFDLAYNIMSEHNTIYGYYIQDVNAKYTPDMQVYQVDFIGVDYADHPWNEVPFRDFLTKKFGMETARNKWVVGDRTITIEREMLKRGFFYSMKLSRENPHIDYDNNDQFNFYLMRFTSDSMLRENERQIQEHYKQKKQELQELQKSQDIQKQKDLEAL